MIESVVKVKGAIEGYKLAPFHDTAVEIVVGDGAKESSHVLDLEGALAFLATPLEHKPLKVFWDLDQSVAPILRLLGPEMCEQLHKTNRCRPKPYSIFYLPGKVFSVKHAAYTRASFYGLNQYYPDAPEPADTRALCTYGARLLGALHKMGLQPRKLTSPIAIWEDCVMSHLSLPTYRDAPDKANIYAWRASGQLWVEAHKLGYWDEAHPVFDYDISGCFPNIAKDLIDFRHCDWRDSDEYEAGAYYGYCHGVVTIYDWVKVSPILYASKDGLLISPVGTWEAWLNKAQIDFIRKWGIGEFHIIDGVWAFPKKITHPLRLVMERLLRYKEHDDEVVCTVAKGQSVGIYGYMLAEYKDGFGPYWNPVWGDEISTGGGLAVADWLYRHSIGPGDNKGYQSLICINVDGVTLSEEAEVMPVDVKWKLAHVGPALVVGSGLVFMGDKHPRGFTLERVAAMFKAHPRKGYYEEVMKRRVTLADAVGRDRLQDIGKVVPMYSAVDLYRALHDRHFPKEPRDGGQLLTKVFSSTPIQVKEAKDDR